VTSEPVVFAVVPAFQDADLFVLGSNVERSPLVLFEAAAAGTSFASTPCGNASEIAAWFGSGLVVPGSIGADGATLVSAAATAAGIDSVLGDLDSRRGRRDRAREIWRELSTWDAIAERYEEVYRRAVSRRGGG
jgi:glycosyltransferase involved in cell wall biosynthesis